MHRCALAHGMADAQDDPTEELMWDLRALRAAAGITDDRTAQAGMTVQAAALLPSLHLNLGDVYLRLGETAAARQHLKDGLEAANALPQDGYGAMIRRGLLGLADRLDVS